MSSDEDEDDTVPYCRVDPEIVENPRQLFIELRRANVWNSPLAKLILGNYNPQSPAWTAAEDNEMTVKATIYNQTFRQPEPGIVVVSNKRRIKPQAIKINTRAAPGTNRAVLTKIKQIGKTKKGIQKKFSTWTTSK